MSAQGSLISFGCGASEAGLQEQRVADAGLVKAAKFGDRFEGNERHQQHEVVIRGTRQLTLVLLYNTYNPHESSKLGILVLFLINFVKS